MEEALAELLELETEYDDIDWLNNEEKYKMGKTLSKEIKFPPPPAWEPVSKGKILLGLKKLDDIEEAIPILSGMDVFNLLNRVKREEKLIAESIGEQRFIIEEILWVIDQIHRVASKVLSSGVTRYSMK